MRFTWIPALLVLSTACGGSHAAANARAKARIFAPAGDDRPASPPKIDVAALAGSSESSTEAEDAVLDMPETELHQRAGSFRLKAKLHLSFMGPGHSLAIDEDRLTEQAKNGDVHLRLEDSNGDGMEVLSVGGNVYGRSRYGPYVLRDRQSGLADQREDVAGALATLYRLADRGLRLHAIGAGQGCTRFEVSPGTARTSGDAPRFSGRLDSDTAVRFQFVYGRRLTEAGGEICVTPEGLVTAAHLALKWVAGGDAGTGEVRANLDETLSELGGDVHLGIPEGFEPEPHRPHGPFATLDRFGFIHRPDAGSP